MINISESKKIIDTFYKDLLQTEDKITHKRLTADKWSLREIIGHLIDSAANNHQRFVRLQFGDLAAFPAYDGEEWIKVQKYINMESGVLAALWYNYNCLLLNIIANTDAAAYVNVWYKDDNKLTLGKLTEDYFKHLELHIDHFKKRREELLNEV